MNRPAFPRSNRPVRTIPLRILLLLASNRSDPRWPHFLIGRLPAMTVMKAGDLFGTGLPEHVRTSYRCPLPSPIDSHDTLEGQRLPSIRWGLQVPSSSPSYRVSKGIVIYQEFTIRRGNSNLADFDGS
jgi:hypothetical protein